MIKKITLLALLFILNIFYSQKILFDATKGEMAGNADWVIDADLHNLSVTTSGTEITGGTDSNPQRIPNPFQSGITSTTSETYWTGALSSWAIDLVKKGYTVETLPYNGKITYGDATNAQDLSNYKVYIIDEPNIKFTVAESTAIVNFVKNGGGLFMISDHTVSDRNNDGWDSPDIWNDLMANNTVLANPFGIKFDLANISETSSNVANLPTNAILHGTAGTPTQMQYSNGTTITLNKTVNSSALGLIFKTGSSTTGTTGVMVAQATYGTGKVCALGDSSVPDDGTGDTGDTLYNGYTGDASGNHKPFLINAVIWLATNPIVLGTQNNSSSEFSIYPNPSSDFINFKGNFSKTIEYSIADVSGRTFLKSTTTGNQLDVRNLSKGVYILNLKIENQTKTFKFIKN